MEQFTVELVGGPFPGPRELRTPRAEPPHQIPIVRKVRPSSADESPADDPAPPERRRIAVYRYSSRRPDGPYVYHFVGERGDVERRGGVERH